MRPATPARRTMSHPVGARHAQDEGDAVTRPSLTPKTAAPGPAAPEMPVVVRQVASCSGRELTRSA